MELLLNVYLPVKIIIVVVETRRNKQSGMFNNGAGKTPRGHVGMTELRAPLRFLYNFRSVVSEQVVLGRLKHYTSALYSRIIL